MRVTIELFDMLSDNSEVDHPLCEECTDTLLESMEQQLELAESDAQEYADYLARLNSETEEGSCVAQLETELRQLQLEEAGLMTDLSSLKAEDGEIEAKLAAATQQRGNDGAKRPRNEEAGRQARRGYCPKRQ